MDKDKILQQMEVIEGLLEPVFDNDVDNFNVIYGVVSEYGRLGWYYVHNDYPSFIVIWLGEIYELALANAQGIYDEWYREQEEDEDEDELDD